MNNGNPFYVGVVEDSRTDHLMLGRCKVRVVGLHIQDKAVLPTADLPWAMLMSPANTAGSSGIGSSPIGPVEGSTVMVIFNDPPYNQQPMIIGTMQGIPQDESVINDKLEVEPKMIDELSQVGRAIPTNLLQAVANQLSNFNPLTFDIPGVLDPFDIMRTLKAQLNAFASISLSLNFPGVSLSAGFNLSTGLYGSASLNGLVTYIPSEFSIHSGAIDNAALYVGQISNLYGGVSRTLSDINLTVDAIINGSTNYAPITTLPRLLTVFPLLESTTNDSAKLAEDRRIVSAIQAQIDLGVGHFKNSVRNGKTWESCALEPPKTIDDFIEWCQFWLTEPCKSQLKDKVAAVISEFGSDEAGAVAALIKWAEGCESCGSGGKGGSSITCTIKAPSLRCFPNLCEIWCPIEGGSLSASGKIIGLTIPLTGWPNGITTTAMVTCDSMYSAIYGTAAACGSYLCKPIKDCLQKHAKKIKGVISTSYPPWSLTSKVCNPPNKLLPPPQGMFTEVGNVAVSSLVSPLPNIAHKLISLTAPEEDEVYKRPTSSCNATGGSNEIPTFPPEWYDQQARRSQGIKALLAAAKKLGLSTKEQKCTILAICGGECGWIPQAETHKWSDPDRLLDTFKSTFRGDRKAAERFTNWQGSKASFFEYLYSCTNHKGTALGNTCGGDGGKYYGRGFIMLVGKSNYQKYATISGYDIVSNPSLLLCNLTVAAEVAIYYFKDRVNQILPPSSNPGYFEAASELVNNQYEKELKRKLYEYFYGIPTMDSLQACAKTALIEPPSSANGRLSQDIVNGRFPPNAAANTGFKDPNSKYPLKNNVFRPDSNALARGVTKDTIVPLKESKRTRGIRMPFGQGNLDQPAPAYAAVYPFNRVTETESGHIQEFDDTPGAERIHTYHRSGTFNEIDAGGNQVNKIVGDNYTIVDNNGVISVNGKATIHVKGDINIYSQSDVNVQTEGSAHMEVGGDFDLKIARNYNVSVGGKFNLWSTGGNTIHTDGSTLMFSKKEFYNFAILRLAHVTTDDLALQSDKKMDIYSRGDMAISTGEGEMNIKVEQDTLYVETNNNLELKCPNKIKADSPARIGEFVGKATSEGALLARFDGHMRYPPKAIPTCPVGSPISHRPGGADPVADSGSTDQTQKYQYETPDDYNSPGGQAAIQQEQTQQGTKNNFKGQQAPACSGGKTLPPVEDTLTGIATTVNTANNIVNTAANIATSISEFGSQGRMNIANTSDPNYFTNDFRLSTHINIGMFLMPYAPRYHKLIAQNGLTLQQIVNNLINVAQNIVEPMIEHKVLPGGIGGLGRLWQIISVFRLGVSQSQHNKGMAIDFCLPPATVNRREKTWELIQKVEKVIDYDQLILEYRNDSCWIHASYDAVKRRKLAFTMNNDQTVCLGFKLLT